MSAPVTIAALVVAALAFAIALLAVRQGAAAARAADALRAEVVEVRAELAAVQDQLDALGPLMADTRSALRHAERRGTRADDLVIAATSVTQRADAASALAYRVAASPVVRLLAAWRGLRRGIAALLGQRS